MIKHFIINSGGQTGADRAAIDAAIETSKVYSGWCPAGGWAEDLTLPPGLLARYPLMKETPSSVVEQRTEWNVRDSTATMIFLPSPSFRRSPGTNYTLDMAMKWLKPCLVVDLANACAIDAMMGFLSGLNQRSVVLNCAGPRESEANGTYDRTKALIRSLINKLEELS